MAYTLNGASGEGNSFTAAIASFALEALSASSGLVDYTTVVTTEQGNTYKIPLFPALGFQDYLPQAGGGGSTGYGNANVQNPAITQSTITATPAVCATAFDIFLADTTSFQLAATLGSEMGGAFSEKVDQRVAAAFLGFKATPVNSVVANADGFDVVTAMGAMELQKQGGAVNATAAAFISNTVLGLVQKIKQNYVVARLPGTPIIVLDSDGDDTVAGSSMLRALSELSGGAVTTAANSGGSAITSLGEELLATGTLSNLYGCRVIFSNFLQDVVGGLGTNGEINGLATAVKVGSYMHESSVYTLIKKSLEVKIGESPYGLQSWLTGVAYFGSNVADQRRGGAINIAQA
jgi:hypothetical protein